MDYRVEDYTGQMKELEKIIGLVTGNIAEDQKNDILNRVKDDTQLKKEYNSVKNAWALSSSQGEVPQLQVEKSYLSLKSKISNQKPSVRFQIVSVFKYAAIIFVVFALGIYSDSVSEFVFGDKFATNKQTEIIVPAGQVAEVNLPDGSHVWLNAGTHLSFNTNFSSRTRQVQLTGEAFFEVRKGHREFVVSTTAGDITVLGTSFNVCAFDNGEFQTTLVEGSIRYTNATMKKEIILTPGQQLILSENKDIVEVRDVEPTRYFSWRNGVIAFEKEPLRSVIRKLERHFAIKIEMDDSLLGNIRFTGSIEAENVLEVMEYINKTKPIDYSYNKTLKTLTIKSKE